MDLFVAVCAYRDQVLLYVISQLAPQLDVMDLKVDSAAACLAAPAIAPQYLVA